MNVRRIDFDEPKYAYPAFLTLIFIPFTTSTFVGVNIGYVTYIFLSIMTLDIIDNVKTLYDDVSSRFKKKFKRKKFGAENDEGETTGDERSSVFEELFSTDFDTASDHISNPLVY